MSIRPQTGSTRPMSTWAMDINKANPTKDAALHQLGLRTKRARNRVSPHFEFTTVRAGRQLVTRKTFMPAIVVAVSGSANVSLNGEHLCHLEAPFVVDLFATDDRGVAVLDVVASADSMLFLIDRRRRELAFEQVPELERVLSSTKERIATRAVIDVTEREPVHVT